jgi:hypothetical protein
MNRVRRYAFWWEDSLRNAIWAASRESRLTRELACFRE